jgi:homoserine dehydrogenase
MQISPDEGDMMDAVGVGMLGLGTVGSAVARLLHRDGERLASRAGRGMRIVHAAVRNPGRPRDVPLDAERITDDARRVLRDPAVSVVVELIGGIEPARSLILEALSAGKDVVTANKALLAEHGTEIFAEARRAGRCVAFEGSVAGGIPIVQALSVGLAANQVQSLAAILNGTCNYILTAMSTEGLPYATALRHAQELGFAEADPKLDVDGTDTAHKLAILTQVAFGASITTADIPRQGIDRLDTADIRHAAELGYAIKLLALARVAPDGALGLRVAPRLVRQGTPLADVRGAYNAVRVVGDVVGEALFYGLGAGASPTASAVVGDLIDVVSGRAARTFAVQNLWPDPAPRRSLAGPDRVRQRYYLRFQAADRPGVIGQITQVLGRHEISIASVIQHDPGEDDAPGSTVPLILMTHTANEAALQAALIEIDELDAVKARSVCYGVEE